MKIDFIAPIVLDYAVQFLRRRPIGTKYHPQTNIFIIDCKLLSRILKHNGNMKAETTKSENMFSAHIIQYLIEERIIQSSFSSGSYEIKTKNGLNYAIEVVKYGKLHSVLNKGGKYGRHNDGHRDGEVSRPDTESLDGNGATANC